MDGHKRIPESTTAFVHDLPLEILEEIFLNCIPPYTVFSPREAPLLLCSVCSSWRSVALGAPRLWSHISIDISNLISGHCHEDLKQPGILILHRFLARSGGIPLSFQISATSPEILDHPGWRLPLLQIMNECHDRIQNLEFSSSWLNHFLRSIPSHVAFPKLASVTITSFNNGPSFDALPTPFTSFSNADRLRRIRYNAYISQETAVNLGFRWEQLTHLTLADVDSIPWTHLFRRCTGLESGTFIVSGASAQPLSNLSYDHYDCIDFPSLSYLSLRNAQLHSGPTRSALNLGCYNFPKLRELHLSWEYSPGFSDLSFLSTIQALQTLAIFNTPFHTIAAHEILAMLRLTPTISKLRLSSDHCVADILEALTYHPHHQSPLVPELQVLVLEISSWSSVVYDQLPTVVDRLKKAIGSRWWVYSKSKVRKLRRVELVLPKGEIEGVGRLLQPYTDAGLELVLCYGSDVGCGDQGRIKM